MFISMRSPSARAGGEDKGVPPLTILNSYNQISKLNLNSFLEFSHVSVLSVWSFPTHTCLWVFQVSDITDTVFCLIIITIAGRFQTCPYDHGID